MGRFDSMSFRFVVLFLLVCAGSSSLYASDQASFHVMAVFNIRDYGASGKKADDARAAIQKAIDAAAAAGGGVVYLPPGAYTSGTLRLRSHVNIYIESGATLFGSEDPAAFDSQKVK
jgi:polygalacturonase